MKKLIIIALLLSSCSPDWHIRRAKFKQPDILTSFNDTITLKDVRIDTLWYADTFIVAYTLTKRDTIIQTRYLKPRTRHEIRYEYKTIRDTVKIRERHATRQNRTDNRTERVVTRQENKRSRWWMWLGIGVFVGIFRKKLFSLLKYF
jgi:hypothetical protein